MSRYFDHLIGTKPRLLLEALDRGELLILVLIRDVLRLDLILGQALAYAKPSHQRVSLVRCKTHALSVLHTLHDLSKVTFKRPRLWVSKLHSHSL